MAPTTITAEMADGSTIVEHVFRFEDFTALVLGFRRDSECERLTWHNTGALALLDLLAADMAGMLAEAREAGCWPVVALHGEVAS